MPTRNKKFKKKKKKKKKKKEQADFDTLSKTQNETIQLGPFGESITLDLGLIQLDFGWDYVRAGTEWDVEIFGMEASATAGLTLSEDGLAFDMGLNSEGLVGASLSISGCNGVLELKTWGASKEIHFFEKAGCKEEEGKEEYGQKEAPKPPWDEDDWGEDEDVREKSGSHHIDGDPDEFVAAIVSIRNYSYSQSESWNSSAGATYRDSWTVLQEARVGSFKPDGLNGVITLSSEYSSTKTATVGAFPLSESSGLDYNNFSGEWRQEWGILPQDKGKEGRVYDYFFKHMRFTERFSSTESQVTLTPNSFKRSASHKASVTMASPEVYQNNESYADAYGSPPSDSYERSSVIEDRGYNQPFGSTGIWGILEGRLVYYARGTRATINRELQTRWIDETTRRVRTGSFTVGGTSYANRNRTFTRKDHTIQVYKFDSERKKPSPPPPMKQKCCEGQLRLLKQIKKDTEEIKDAIGTEEIVKSEIPFSFLFPGGQGTKKMKNLSDIFESLFLAVNRGSFIPFAVPFLDSKQDSEPLFYPTLSHALEDLIKAAKSGSSEEAEVQNFNVRMATSLALLQKALARTLVKLENLEEFLGYRTEQVKKKIRIPFDILQGAKSDEEFEKIKKAIEDGDSDAIEAMIPRLLTFREQEYKVEEIVPQKRFNEYIVEILNAVKSRAPGGRLG